MWNGQICKKLDVGSNNLYLPRKGDTESYFPLSPFSEVDNTERNSPFSFTEVDNLSRTNFGVGKRQQLRKDVELVLMHRIDDRAYLFGFHWKESLWSANLRRLNRQTKPRVG